MIEIDNELYAAVQALGRDTVMELAQGLVRARQLHPVFAYSVAEAASVVNNEAGELMASVYDKESPDRQHAEALDTAVTAIRYLKLEWLPEFGDRKPVEASEGVKVAFDADDDFEGVSEAPVTLYEVMGQTAQEAPAGKRERGSVLLEAVETINGARQDVYGAPEDSFALISDYWTTYVRSKSAEVANAGFCLEADDVAMMMTLFKIAREANQHKRDNIVDAAGYLGIYADMMEAVDAVE